MIFTIIYYFSQFLFFFFNFRATYKDKVSVWFFFFVPLPLAFLWQSALYPQCFFFFAKVSRHFSIKWTLFFFLVPRNTGVKVSKCHWRRIHVGEAVLQRLNWEQHRSNSLLPPRIPLFLLWVLHCRQSYGRRNTQQRKKKRKTHHEDMWRTFACI